jgi:hypothetical protein
MKKVAMWAWTLALLVALVDWAIGAAAPVELLPVEGMARWGGATHVVTVKDETLTTSTTNTAETLTLSVASNQYVELMFAVVTERFSDATNANNTLTVIVGDGTDDDLFLLSTELCVYGTEVLAKPGRSWQEGVTVTTTSAQVAGTNFLKSATIAAQTIGRKVYTVADTVDFKFTPKVNYAVSDFDAGEIKFYLKIYDTIGN